MAGAACEPCCQVPRAASPLPDLDKLQDTGKLAVGAWLDQPVRFPEQAHNGMTSQFSLSRLLRGHKTALLFCQVFSAGSASHDLRLLRRLASLKWRHGWVSKLSTD